jgi:hypothetical protein
LLTAQCIEENRRDEFHKTVFGNYMTFVHIHRELYRELRDYQLYCQEVQGNGFIDEIGIIFLKYIDKFKDAYVSYGSNVLLGEYEAKQEMANNILFHNFIREKEKQAETRKLAFRHFILAPISRLQRYPLLLNAILKRTNDQHPDRANIVEAIQRIKNIAEKMDLAAEHAEQKLRLKKINACIQFKSDQKVVDLELLKPERRLLYEGPLKRRSHLGVEMIDIYVFLFDHLLLMTHKNARTDHNIGEEKWTYTVSKRPIPLNLLTVKDATDIFLFNSFKGIATPATAITSPNLPDSPASTVSGKSITGVNPYINQPPLLLTHLGRDGGEYVISADTPKARLLLKESILRAKKELSTLQKGVFQKVLINEPAFALSGIVQNCGRVVCSAQYGKSNFISVCFRKLRVPINTEFCLS